METQQIIAWRAVTVSLTTFCHQSDKLSEMFQNLLLNITTCASEYSRIAFEEEFKLVSTADDENTRSSSD